MIPLERADAFFRFQDGYLWAEGPWVEVSEPVLGIPRPVFLAPRFSSGSSRTWLEAQSWGVCTADEARAWIPTRAQDSLEVDWSEANPKDFFEAVERSKRRMKELGLQKIVPVYPWRAQLSEECPWTHFLSSLLHAPESTHPYYFRFQDRSVVGVSPERLFAVERRMLRTQAVAGTAPLERAGELLKSPKDLREHELVCDYLQSQLSNLGRVSRAPLEVRRFSVLAHLITDFSVLCDLNFSVQSALDWLHPTPALGVFPRQIEHLKFLEGLRGDMGVDDTFGAPFGFVFGETAQFLVGIRNLILKNQELVLNTGCGVLLESDPQAEWDELKLKREAVCKNLNLTT